MDDFQRIAGKKGWSSAVVSMMALGVTIRVSLGSGFRIRTRDSFAGSCFKRSGLPRIAGEGGVIRKLGLGLSSTG